ncbi:MAG: lysophospholipid acyltransferase family protein [Nitrospirota bacterium]|nr:lysophospholipid acyltransferase family protein [Nitrospirota bacterium]
MKLSVAPPLAARTIRLLGHTMRVSTIGGETVDELYGQGKRIIIAFWHGRQLMMPLAYRGQLASILISQHRDGEIIARIMQYFGFKAIRGSSTRGGLRAIRQLVKAGRDGGDLVVTPDGPKGPACKVQSGVVYLAKATGFPIIPLTFACSKKKSFRVGITFKFPIPVGRDYLCGANPYG